MNSSQSVHEHRWRRHKQNAWQKNKSNIWTQKKGTHKKKKIFEISDLVVFFWLLNISLKKWPQHSFSFPRVRTDQKKNRKNNEDKFKFQTIISSKIWAGQRRPSMMVSVCFQVFIVVILAGTLKCSRWCCCCCCYSHAQKQWLHQLDLLNFVRPSIRIHSHTHTQLNNNRKKGSDQMEIIVQNCTELHNIKRETFWGWNHRKNTHTTTTQFTHTQNDKSKERENSVSHSSTSKKILQSA